MYGPPHLVTQFTNSDIVRRRIGVWGLKTVLKILVALGVGRVLNRIQNLRATNNWSLFVHGNWSWSEEIAIVTGGCNGIGKAIVLALVQRGLRVAILDVVELPSELQKIDSVFYWKCDISSASAVAEAADSIGEMVGHPSILINNAGMANRSSILDLAPEKASKLFGDDKKAIERGGTNKMMKPEDVAKVVADQIFSRRGAQLIIPSRASWLSGFRGLPNWFQEILRDSIGQ
ncbi:hypothetical protein K4K57_010189 [Colletotrichum sp. SAR 10_99]|nr:hypothetical protein K4K57_010189 [Colletotrichum sp. SAR 10_99]